jgi:hypothetical protein
VLLLALALVLLLLLLALLRLHLQGMRLGLPAYWRRNLQLIELSFFGKSVDLSVCVVVRCVLCVVCCVLCVVWC